MKHLTLIVLSAALLLLASCGGAAVTDYSANETYAAFFSEADDADTKQLKNVIIAHLEAYNNGDAEGYYELFDMERDDRNFNIAQFNSMRQTYTMTYTPEEIATAFINEDNAQALITMTCRCENSTTGEVVYYYRTTQTYTMVRDGAWRVTLQTPGAEEDLMNGDVSDLFTDTAETE